MSVTTFVLVVLLACAGDDARENRAPSDTAVSISPSPPTTRLDSLTARVHELAAPLNARYQSLRSDLAAASGTPRADSVMMRARRSLYATVLAFQRAIDDTAFQATIWPEYRQVHMGPAPTTADTIAADALRRALARHGIWDEVAEADTYLSFSEQYLRDLSHSYLTSAGRDFLDIEVREQTRRTGGDAAVSIPWDSLAERLATTDRFLVEHAGSALDSLVKERRIWYLRAYLTGWENTSVFATTWRPPRAEARASYERFVRRYESTTSGTVVREYLDVLEASRWRRTDAVREFLRAHLDDRV